jgi:hypothetical protein
MANDVTGLVWHLDTVGVISSTPVHMKKVVLNINAAADAVLMNYWNRYSGDTRSTADGATTTTSGTNTITSTGAFTTAKVVVGDIIEITHSSTGSNIGSYVVITRTNDDAIVIAGTLTNEASATYTFKIYKGHRAVYILSPGTEKAQTEMDFNEGIDYPNLALYTLTSSATVDIYV